MGNSKFILFHTNSHVPRGTTKHEKQTQISTMSSRTWSGIQLKYKRIEDHKISFSYKLPCSYGAQRRMKNGGLARDCRSDQAKRIRHRSVKMGTKGVPILRSCSIRRVVVGWATFFLPNIKYEIDRRSHFWWQVNSYLFIIEFYFHTNSHDPVEHNKRWKIWTSNIERSTLNIE